MQLTYWCLILCLECYIILINYKLKIFYVSRRNIINFNFYDVYKNQNANINKYLQLLQLYQKPKSITRKNVHFP